MDNHICVLHFHIVEKPYPRTQMQLRIFIRISSSTPKNILTKHSLVLSFMLHGRCPSLSWGWIEQDGKQGWMGDETQWLEGSRWEKGWYTTSVCRYRGTREGSSCSLTWLSQAYRTSCIAERKMASTWPRVAPTLCLIICHVPRPSWHITHVESFKHSVNLKYDKSEKVGCRWTYNRPG